MMRLIFQRSMVLMVFVFFCLLELNCGNTEEKKEVSVKNSRNEKKEISGTDKKNDEKSERKIISSKEAAGYIGESLTVEGYVADVYTSEKVSYLNFDKKFPNNIFTCVIFNKDKDNFGNLMKYRNKNVSVNGKITTYKNKPQIILRSSDQIKILNE